MLPNSSCSPRFMVWFCWVNGFEKLTIPFCINTKNIRKVRHCASSKVPWKRVFKNKVKCKVRLTKTVHQKKTRKVCIYIKERKSALKSIAVYNKITDSSYFSIYVTNRLDMTGKFLY